MALKADASPGASNATTDPAAEGSPPTASETATPTTPMPENTPANDNAVRPKHPTLQPAAWMNRIGEVQLLPYLDKWRQRFRVDPRTGLPLTPLNPDPEELSFEKLAFKTGAGLRVALRLFVPITASVFLASFLVDHPVWRPLLRSVSIAGLIGFGTNWIAIKMLFRPRETRPIFGQGLIPSQRDEIIRKVADEVIEKLINENIIRQELEDSRLISRLVEETTLELQRLVRDPELVQDTKQLVLTYAAKMAQSDSFREEVTSEVERRVEEVAGSSFASWLVNRMRGVWREPVMRIVNTELDDLPQTLDRLVGEVDTALDHIPAFLEERHDRIEEMMTRVMMSIIREIDVRKVVIKQLSTVTSEQLEVGFREFADDKLSYITLLGGILGCVGGFVIVWPLGSALILAALVAITAISDIVLHAVIGRLARGRHPRVPGESPANPTASRDENASRPTPKASADATETSSG